jgi:hypothetical protein
MKEMIKTNKSFVQDVIMYLLWRVSHSYYSHHHQQQQILPNLQKLMLMKLVALLHYVLYAKETK